MTSSKRLLATLPMVLLAAGCAIGDGDGRPGNMDPKAFGAAKGDQWDDRNDPALFSEDLEYRLDALPQEGRAAQVPWPGTYWATHRDSINQHWDGEDSVSPSAKYGQAFGIDNLEDIVSDHYGIDRYRIRKACTSSDDCSDPGDGVCSKREGAESGRCIPSWWGICHAWAPAAIMESEPVDPVTRNGVEFKVNDLKALLTLMYNRSESKFLSMRCNDNSSGADPMGFDEFGNPVSSKCKDTNAGTFHVVATNYLGLRGESFVEDRTFDDEVWNQPVAGYRVKILEEVSVSEAHKLLGLPFVFGPDTETHELKGKVEAEQWFEGNAFVVPAGHAMRVTMATSGDNDADLFLKVGSTPTSDSYDCRPWGASNKTEVCDLKAADQEREVFVSVLGKSDETQFQALVRISEIQDEDNLVYQFNSEAKSLVHVMTEFDYITESSAHTDGNLAVEVDNYIRTDSYEYVLELDGFGEIIGGEWVGASRQGHPDFLWLPTGRGKAPIAGGAISYAMVKSMLNESIGQSASMAGVSEREDSVIERGRTIVFGPYDVDGDVFEVAMRGTGDADLFVRRDEIPTADSFDCRPYMKGSVETCSLEGAGKYYVVVYGYTHSEFRLDISYTTTDLSLAPVITEEGLGANDAVEPGETAETMDNTEYP